MKYLLVFVVMYFLSSSLLKCKMGDESEWYKITLDTIVGETIDSMENTKYDLFSIKEGFIRAEIFYHRNVAFIEVVMKISDKKNNSYDTTFIISYYDLVEMVEKVQFHEEIKSGVYKIGTRKPVITNNNYNLMLVIGDFSYRIIPLSPNREHYKREKFTTIKYLISFGLAFRDTKSLKDLITINSENHLHIGGFMDIPIFESPHISFRIGTNSVFGGNANTFSASFLYKIFLPGTSISGIVGLGFAHTELISYGGFTLKARKSYPIVCLGFNLIKDWIDVMSSIGISKNQSTIFEGRRYNIDVAGIQVDLYLIL